MPRPLKYFPRARFLPACRLLLIGLLANAPLRAGPDHELWLTGVARFAAPAACEGELQMQEKLRHDAHKAYDYEEELNFTHALRGPWSATVGFTHVDSLNGAVWLQENRPTASLNWRETLADWSVALRARVEYRDREARPDGWRYRARAQLGLPMEKGSHWKPYVSAEGFYDGAVGRWNQTRLFAGVGHVWSVRWSDEIFAGSRGDLKAAQWRRTPVLGLKLALKL